MHHVSWCPGWKEVADKLWNDEDRDECEGKGRGQKVLWKIVQCHPAGNCGIPSPSLVERGKGKEWFSETGAGPQMERFCKSKETLNRQYLEDKYSGLSLLTHWQNPTQAEAKGGGIWFT